MLAGTTRIRLMRQLHHQPGQNIAELAANLGISRPYASQEMRRIQSRGFLQATRRGASLVYWFRPDPQVATAAPLLKAVRTALDQLAPAKDAQIAAIAAGLAHERRIAMARALMHSAGPPRQLRIALPMAPRSFQLHLRTLGAGGFVRSTRCGLRFQTPAHPLGRALARLLRQDIPC